MASPRKDSGVVPTSDEIGANQNSKVATTTTLSASVTLRIEVPETGQSTKMRFSPYSAVKDVEMAIAKELNIKSKDPYGLFVKTIRDGQEIGTWLLEERTLWSYQLEDQTLAEFKPKTVEHHEIRVVVPAQEIASTLSYDQFTTVKEVIQEIQGHSKLGSTKDKYGLYLARESLFLNEAETLHSYQMTPQDVIEFKKRTGDQEEKPKSVLLDIGLPQHGTRRKLLVPFTTTVAEVVTMLIRKAALLDTKNYGLYLMPRDNRPGMWMEDYKFLGSFQMQNEEKLEFKSKFKQFVIEINISSHQRPTNNNSPTVAPKGALIMKPFVDDSATVFEAIEMAVAEYSLNPNRKYGLYFYDEEIISLDKKLWDIGNKEPLVFHAVRKPIRIALEVEPEYEETIQVDFDEVVSKIGLTMARRFGVANKISHHLKTETGLDIPSNQTLSEANVAENALLLLVFDNSSTNIRKQNKQKQITRVDSRLVEDDYDTNIWEEGVDSDANILLESSPEGPVVRAGTFNKLVERLTDSKTPDLRYVKTFLLTYQSFATPELLLEKLVERYNVIRAENESYADFQITQRAIQARVCNALKLWMESPQPDFEGNEELQEALLAFLRDVLAVDNPKLAKQLRNSMQKAKAGGAIRERYIGFDESAPEIKLPKNMNENLTLLDFDPEEIARQMTLIDFKYFASIKPAELLNQAWNKEKYHHRAANVMAFIKRINDVGSAVAALILSQKDAKARAKTYSTFVVIANHLYLMNNFSTVMSIIGGLNNSAVSRLKHTRKELDKKIVKKLAEIEEVMSPRSNYKSLRDQLHKVDPPCLPYLGVYTSDLTFLDDGNPNFLGDLINFEKRKLVYTIISDLITYQNKPFNFMPFPELKSLLTSLQTYSDKELYDFSLKREPRE